MTDAMANKMVTHTTINSTRYTRYKAQVIILNAGCVTVNNLNHLLNPRQQRFTLEVLRFLPSKSGIHLTFSLSVMTGTRSCTCHQTISLNELLPNISSIFLLMPNSRVPLCLFFVLSAESDDCRALKP